MTVVLKDSSSGSHYINSRLGVWTPKLGSSRIVALMEQITRKVPYRIVHILPAVSKRLVSLPHVAGAGW